MTTPKVNMRMKSNETQVLLPTWPVQAWVVHLRHEHGMTMDAIAERLNIHRDTVKSHLGYD